MHRPIVLDIELPARLASLLSRDRRLDGAIKTAIADFSEWLAQNHTVFFPDYTDHGVAHVSNVLASAEAIIAEDSWNELTPEDASAIIAAGLLHDCAMHLSLDGFRSLLKGSTKAASSKLYIDILSWTDEYQSFLQEAARWDREKLIVVFGGDEPVAAPAADLADVSDPQKLLIGEFVRRHHARMAHEFALDGVPGPSGNLFHPFRGLDFDTRDLYGFIARSHNLSIRSAVDKLPELSHPVWMHVHVPFVMAVLRIADYIQIDSQRAARRVLHLRSLRSPVSRLEWAKHHAVQDLHNWGNDPEALNVNASPPNVLVFAGLRRLFADVQRELDEVWATLGEVYGRLGPLASLGIRVRRLRSSLDDLSKFESQYKPTYVPRELRMTTASAELLHLLVVPLYGERPSIGVRELLQNSLDACNERASFSRRHAQGQDDYVPEITVSIAPADDNFDFSLADNGCGMTLPTLEDFFLKAGASFRRSQWWKSEFMTEDGHSIVRRTGRFGVGVLAAFLLGSRVRVETRHFLDESGLGYAFSLSLSNELIEMHAIEMPIGTRIIVEGLDRSKVDQLIYPKDNPAFNQWYFLSDPKVRYVGPDGDALLRSPLARDLDDVEGDERWTEVECQGFSSIAWSYDSKATIGRLDYVYYRRYLACNGIFVGNSGHGVTPALAISEKWSPFKIEHPSLVVEDKDGRLPLNIQRSGIVATEYPFHEQFVRSIAGKYADGLIAALDLKPEPSLFSSAISGVISVARSFYEHSHYYASKGMPMVGLCKAGWFVFEEPLVRDLEFDMVIMEMVTPGVELACSKANFDDLPRTVLLPAIYDGHGKGNCKHFFRGAYDDAVLRCVGRFAPSGVIFLHSTMAGNLTTPPRVPKYVLDAMNEFDIGDGWKAFSFGEGIDGELFAMVSMWLKGSGSLALAVLNTQKLADHAPGITELASAWLSRLGAPLTSSTPVRKRRKKMMTEV